MQIIISLFILIISVIIHEVAHGSVAYLLGDPTAKDAGRLTLNPLAHLDWVGSVFVPLILYSLGGVVFGWAKPVPFNPYNLRWQRWGPATVALAGPAANLSLALIFGLLVRFTGLAAVLSTTAFNLILLVVLLNVTLAIFNLLPIVPLDGSKLLFALIPFRYRHWEEWLYRHQFFIFIILLLLVVNTTILERVSFGLFFLLTGVGV